MKQIQPPLARHTKQHGSPSYSMRGGRECLRSKESERLAAATAAAAAANRQQTKDNRKQTTTTTPPTT
eukprot:6115159-Amphidinium_carterae.1